MNPADIRDFRYRHNLSQTDCARLAGVDRATWSLWERRGRQNWYVPEWMWTGITIAAQLREESL